MSQTITIPANVQDLTVTINNTSYTYRGGSTVTVPDEVAEVIANIEANAPKEKTFPEGQLYTSDGRGGADFKDFIYPMASSDEAGVVLKAEAVAPATDADDIVAQFNALLGALEDAGIIAEYVAPEPEPEAPEDETPEDESPEDEDPETTE